MIVKLTKTQSRRVVEAVDAAEKCIDALRLLKKKRITTKDRIKFKTCLSKVLGVKLK